MAGNVCEWTATCYARNALDAGVVAATVNCGIRVVEGRHRTYMSDFIRDARAGGCSVGTPPRNLGFRLVRDDPWSAREWLSAWARHLFAAALSGAAVDRWRDRQAIRSAVITCAPMAASAS